MDPVRQSIYKASTLCLCVQTEPRTQGRPHYEQGRKEPRTQRPPAL